MVQDTKPSLDFFGTFFLQLAMRLWSHSHRMHE